MEAHVHSCAFVCPADAAALVIARLAQAGIDKQLAELIAERCDPASAHEFESARVDWRARVVGAGGEGKECEQRVTDLTDRVKFFSGPLWFFCGPLPDRHQRLS